MSLGEGLIRITGLLISILRYFCAARVVEVLQLWIKIRSLQSKLLSISVIINLIMVIMIHYKSSMPTTLMTELTCRASIVMYVRHCSRCFSKDKCFTAYVSESIGLWHWNRPRGTWYPHKWLLFLSVNSQNITSSWTNRDCTGSQSGGRCSYPGTVSLELSILELQTPDWSDP